MREEEGARKGDEEDIRDQPPSHTASHRIRRNERNIEQGMVKAQRQKGDKII